MNTYTDWQVRRQRRAADLHGTGNGRVHQLTEELAQQDGRTESREFDHEQAWHEIDEPNADLALPEVAAGAEALVTWDVSPEASGHLVPAVATDDEADVDADMAAEGRRQAEQELRRAAHTRAD